MKEELTTLTGVDLALHSIIGHSGNGGVGEAIVAQHQLSEAQRLQSSILHDIKTNPYTYFCPRDVVVEFGPYGTPEWSVMLTSTNTYPYMRVRSKGKPAPNGVCIINEMIIKTSARLNYVRYPFGVDATSGLPPNPHQLLFLTQTVGSYPGYISYITKEWLFQFLQYLQGFNHQDLPCGAVNVLSLMWGHHNPAPLNVRRLLQTRLQGPHPGNPDLPTPVPHNAPRLLGA